MTHWLENIKAVELPEVVRFREHVKEYGETTTSRNENLNKCAFEAGLLIARDQVDVDWVYEILTQASEDNGYAVDYGDTEVERIIETGIEAGKEAAELPDTPESDNPMYGLAMTSQQLKDLPPAKWMIDGIVLENSLVVMFGAPGCGKSFLALDMVGCLANRNRWIGHGIEKNFNCLYILGEGAAGLPDRVAAWEKHNGMQMSGVTFIPRAIPVNSKAWAKLVEYVRETKPGLTVIDTLARMSGNMEDENNATQMGKFIQAADELRNASGGSVLVIHHANRQGGIRGSNALDGAADTMIRLDKEYNDSVEAFITKIKEGETGDLGTFRIKAVDKSAVLIRGALPWSPTPVED